MHNFLHKSSAAVLMAMVAVLGTATSMLAEEEPPAYSRRYDRELDKIGEKFAEFRRTGRADQAKLYETSLKMLLRSFDSNLDKILDNKGNTQKSPLEVQVESARKEIEKLRAAGGAKKADDLLKQLGLFERTDQTGKYDFDKSDEPELHFVSIQQGTTLPKKYAKGDNRLKLGYAEVNINYVVRPVILALSCRMPVLWKVNLAPGARVHAVVLAGNSPQLTGLDSPLAFTLSERLSRGNTSFEKLTGRRVMTRLQEASYVGKPIDVGPANSTWLANYLQPGVQAIIETARHERQQFGLAKLSNIRFEALYFAGVPHSPRGLGFESTSRGTFTIAGPIDHTLRPIRNVKMRKIVRIPNDHRKEFALTDKGLLAVFVSDKVNDKEPVPVPLSTELVGNTTFCSMAFDPKRQRLILSTDEANDFRTVFYDVKESEWTDPIASEFKLYGLTYSVPEDAFYGWVVPDVRNQSQGTLLVKLDADGKVLSETKVDVDKKTGWGDRQVQLILVDDHVVLIGPKMARDLRTGEMRTLKEQLFVIDPASGNVEYSGAIRCHTGGDDDAAKETPAVVAGDGLLAQIDRKLAIAKKDIATLGLTNKKLAATLEPRLAQVHSAIRGEFPKRSKPKLHLVGFHESPSAHIRVTDKSGPITLAVCSFNAANWTIEADEGVQLSRIIVGGYHTQKVKSAPKGVLVEIYSTKQKKAGFYTHGSENAGHLTAIETLKKYSPLEVATFTGNFRPPSEPILIGPENGNWRAQEVLNLLDQLITDANVDQSNQDLTTLRQHTFHAIYYGAMPHAPQQDGPGNKLLFNKFTVDGPLVGRGEYLADTPESLTYDGKNAMIYYKLRDKFVSVNRTTGEQITIEFDQKLPKISRLSGLAVDTKRHRLLATSSGNGGFLYAYDLRRKKWSILRRSGISGHGIAYAPDQDAIFAVATKMFGGAIGEIRKYNSHGALIDRIQLANPISTGRNRLPGNTQVAYFAGYLAILQHEGHQRFRRPGQPPAIVKTSIAVVDLTDGSIAHQGELSPAVERRDLSVEQLEKLWQQLVNSKNPSKNLLWDIAAGHDVTVEFLREKLTQTASAPQDFENTIKSLVEQLDADTFATRNEAFQELQEMGSLILPHLRTHAKSRLSTEANARLRKLIASCETGVPLNARESRMVLAVDILARIGMPNSQKLLRHVASTGLPVVQYRAKIAMEPTAKPGE